MIRKEEQIYACKPLTDTAHSHYYVIKGQRLNVVRLQYMAGGRTQLCVEIRLE